LSQRDHSIVLGKRGQGVTAINKAIMKFNPSASIPSWILVSYNGTSTGCLLTSQLAVTSPFASIIQLTYTNIIGNTIGPYNVSLNVRTQKNVATGGASIGALSNYPQADDTMHPTINPPTTEQLFIIAAPHLFTDSNRHKHQKFLIQ
jgi:hypothetical protein